jgi:hypothetical protein
LGAFVWCNDPAGIVPRRPGQAQNSGLSLPIWRYDFHDWWNFQPPGGVETFKLPKKKLEVVA